MYHKLILYQHITNIRFHKLIIMEFNINSIKTKNTNL